MLQKFMGAVVGLAIPCMTLPAAAQDTSFGLHEYTISCAACHGADGKGDGDMAKLLTVKPADLTVLAKNNGGEYPFLDVFETIDGRTAVAGHGDRVMPIWGDRYLADTKVAPGVSGSELMVRGRIMELAFYIMTIQEE